MGPSGKLLVEALNLAGLQDGTPVYITNAMSCKPPDSAKAMKTAIKACQGRLLEEVGSHPRKVILSLGASALKSLMGRYNLYITAERGKRIQHELGTVVPTFHPAAVLRNPNHYNAMVEDIRLAVDLLYDRDTKDPGETSWTVAETPQQVQAVVRMLRDVDLVGADIEATGLNPRHDRILALGLSWERNKTVIIPAELIVPELFQTGTRWLWHNGKYDTAFLRAAGFPARVDEDTLLLHYTLREQSGIHGLKDMAKDYLGADSYSEEVGQFGQDWASIPQEVLFPYLAKDCDYTLQLYQLLEPRLDATLKRLYRLILLPASNFLQEVEAVGMKVDQEALARLKAELEERLEESLDAATQEAAELWDPERYVQSTGVKSGYESFNPASPMHVKWLVYDRLRRKLPRGFERNTQADTLKALQPPHPFIDRLLEYRKAAKYLKTYVHGIERHTEEDGRVHSTYLLHGTETGRLSSRDPNLQNQPRDLNMRTLFIAGDGEELLDCDMSQAELRILALMSKDPFLVKVYQEGRDLHSDMAGELFGPDFTDEQRTAAKTINFSIAYGLTAYSLAADLKTSAGIIVSETEAQAMIDGWFRRLPQATRYLKRLREAPLQGRVLETPFGRRRRFGLVTDDNRHKLQNEAGNFMIQSIASDVTLLAAMRVHQEVRERWGARIANLVHDSIVFYVPEGKGPEVAEFVTGVMVDTPARTLGTLVPFKADAKIGKRWGEKTP